ncbi:hypothetical protein [Brevundimonas variabilis]|uniref:Uncharacterized protein n=1 Tax=Brevundimonas variabilis TaxID=74312 RepID=A0A7W9CL08_9CAUL|nr:hypothetical protein [Brevundimonas variabilis]MBB5747592.1 hypothetical protein [Brevundimonas variabilis]
MIIAAFLTVLFPAVLLIAPGDELTGNSLTALRSDGAQGVAHFETPTVVSFTGAFEDNLFTARGTYTVKDGQLCLELEEFPKDCWEYPKALEPGVETNLKNVDGALTARFTLHRGLSVPLPEPDR